MRRSRIIIFRPLWPNATLAILIVKTCYRYETKWKGRRHIRQSPPFLALARHRETRCRFVARRSDPESRFDRTPSPHSPSTQAPEARQPGRLRLSQPPQRGEAAGIAFEELAAYSLFICCRTICICAFISSKHCENYQHHPHKQLWRRTCAFG